MRKQYDASPVTRSAAEHLVESLHKEIDKADRKAQVVQVSCSGNVEYNNFGSTYGLYSDFSFITDGLLVSFSDDILPPPEDETEFNCAVCSLAIEMYKVRYPRDKSGTFYSLTFESDDLLNSCSIKYTAPNGFCDAPKS